MAQATLKSKDALKHLISLHRSLGDAISWVSQRKGSITVDLQELSGGYRPLNVGTSCYKTGSVERVHTEVLHGVLKKMGKKSSRRR